MGVTNFDAIALPAGGAITVGGVALGGGGVDVPSVWYDAVPAAGLIPDAASSISTTPQQHQALAVGLAQGLADQILRYSVVAQRILRQSVAGVASGGTVVAHGVNVTVTDADAICQAQLNAPLLLDKANDMAAARRDLAQNAARMIDSTYLLALYPQFTGNPVVGLPGVDLVSTDIDAAADRVCGAMRNFGQAFFALDHSHLMRILVGTHGATSAYGRLQQKHHNRQPLVMEGTGVEILSAGVPRTGSSPVTAHNLMFAPSAMVLASVQRSNANVANTSYYADSVSNGLAVQVLVTYAATGPVVVAIQSRIGAAMVNNKRAVQVES